MKFFFVRCLFYYLIFFPLHIKATEQVLAYVESIPPFVVINQAGISGAAISILNEALRESNVAIDYQNIIWARAFFESKSKPNIILTGLNRTAYREQHFHWLLKLPLTSNRQHVFLWHVKNKKVELKNASLAVVQGEHKKNYYKYYVESLGFTPNIFTVGTRAQVIHMLFRHRVDYMLGGELGMPSMIKELGYDPTMMERGVQLKSTSQGLYIAISKHTDIKLVNRIKKALDDLSKNGRIIEIMSSWE